jgi:RNA polymerase sigma-70 factor, ECF subfamily
MRATTQNSATKVLPSELYAISEAAKFGLRADEFNAFLLDVAGKYLAAGCTVGHIVGFCRRLHLKDLALAQSCARGIDAAWDNFFGLYSWKLQWAACRILKDESRARELADTFCADLFAAGCGRRGESKLVSYTGRGSLENWLKVSLLQASIDFYRAERRYITFDEIANSLTSQPAFIFDFHKDDSKVEDSLKDVLRELDSRDRFILATYFLDRYNLAQIAAALQVHESTISRRLSKALKIVRQNVARKLRERGMNRATISESMQHGPREVSFDMRSELLFGVETVEGRS